MTETSIMKYYAIKMLKINAVPIIITLNMCLIKKNNLNELHKFL